LVGSVTLHNRELAGWWPLGSNSYPNPKPGEIVFFEENCGAKLPSAIY
jgi:hypothetical protein